MYRYNLRGKVDRLVERAIDQLYAAVENLQMKPPTSDQPAAPIVQAGEPNPSLLGTFGTRLIGDSSPVDPEIQTLEPGGGTVSSVAVSGSSNISSAGGPITSSGTITISLVANPDVTSLKVAGTKVVGAQAAAVADATGALDVVAQLNDLLAKLRTHGLIAP